MLKICNKNLSKFFEWGSWLHNKVPQAQRVLQPKASSESSKEIVRDIRRLELINMFDNREQRSIVSHTELLILRHNIKELLEKDRCNYADCIETAQRVSSAIVTTLPNAISSRMKLREAYGPKYPLMRDDAQTSRLFRDGVPYNCTPHKPPKGLEKRPPPLAHLHVGGEDSLYLGSSPNPPESLDERIALTEDSILICHKSISPLGLNVGAFYDMLKHYHYLESFGVLQANLFKNENEIAVVRTIFGENILSVTTPDGEVTINPNYNPTRFY